ncbi:hypothetical protein BD626DRAFT_546513 [Schizophyllum amplum]|uniref:F-box domain-containing protein n=1 Tax=Schizophyllum amplum TaxID=97359 RepID=A0A550CN05_9AGAR|nr:hypothetical protein BD626DRAFT_546513 [Auriculariopsis ampla]
MHWLDLPLEIRLAVYDAFLADHRNVVRVRQPGNAHLVLLRVCKQMAVEGELVGYKRYASLLHEDQIVAFLQCPDSRLFSRITWLDAANDSRLHGGPDPAKARRRIPVSKLYLCMRSLPNLRTLRVFDCHRASPVSRTTVSRQDIGELRRWRLHWQFEPALFAAGRQSSLCAYQLFLTSHSRVGVFEVVEPGPVQSLRLSGNVTSTFFDKDPSESFAYDYGYARDPAFQMHDAFLKEVVQPHGYTLRQLVLLSCDRVTTAALRGCLAELNRLEYFALSFITTKEFDSTFISVLSPSVNIFKVSMTTGKFQIPLEVEEDTLCDSVQHVLLQREPPPTYIAVDLRESVMRTRAARWTKMARQRRIHLVIGPWTVSTDELGRPCD